MEFMHASRLDVPVPYRGAAHPTALWHYPARGTAAARRPVLLIHGFRGDHHGLSFIADRLRTREAYIPDLPGFGATAPLPDGLRIDTYVDYLDGLTSMIEQQTGLPPLVIGHSFGSILTAHWAARHHDTEAAAPLVLINPIVAPALEGTNRVMTRASQLYYWAGRRLPERAGQALLRNRLIVRLMSEVMATTRDPGLRRLIHDQHARHFSDFTDRDSLAEAFEISIRHTVAEVADRLVMPVRVIAGDADAIAPLAAAEAFVGDLPDGRLTVLPGVGHLTHYERPEEIAALIDALDA